jgi:hypothetical protein
VLFVLTLEPSTAMLVAVASPMLRAPWTLSVSAKLFTAVLELVSDLVAARLATVLVAKAFDEVMSCVEASVSEFVELLLLALFDASAKFDDLFAAFDTESVEALDVPNVSEAFFVAAKVVVKPLLDEVFRPAFSVLAAVNEVVLLPEALAVKSPATAGPVVVGLLAVVPVLPEVLPPLAAVLADDELAVSVAVPFPLDAAKAPVALMLPCEFLVVARLPVVASVAAPVLAEVAVRPAFTVDPNVAALVVAEFFEEAALNVSDELLLALAFCAADFVSVLLFIVANVFDLSLLNDLLSVVAVFSEVVRLDAKVLALVTFEFEVIDNWLFFPRW